MTSLFDIFLYAIFCDIEMHNVHSIGNFFSFEIANSIWHSFACRNKESYACTNMLSPFIGGSVVKIIYYITESESK